MLKAVILALLPEATKYVVNVSVGTDEVTLNSIDIPLLPVIENKLLLAVLAAKLTDALLGFQ
jgi:hypothetical protein